MSAEEEARAAAYRAQERRRVAVMRQRALALSGSPSAALDLRRRWEPIAAWLTDRKGAPGGTSDAR